MISTLKHTESSLIAGSPMLESILPLFEQRHEESASASTSTSVELRDRRRTLISHWLQEVVRPSLSLYSNSDSDSLVGGTSISPSQSSQSSQSPSELSEQEVHYKIFEQLSGLLLAEAVQTAQDAGR